MFSRLAIVLCVFWGLAGCGASADPCAKIDCSEGRVCVVRSVGKVACEVPDAGEP